MIHSSIEVNWEWTERRKDHLYPKLFGMVMPILKMKGILFHSFFLMPVCFLFSPSKVPRSFDFGYNSSDLFSIRYSSKFS